MPTVPRYVQTERPQGYQNVQPVAGGAEAMGRAMRGLGDALGGVGRDMWGIAIAERDKFDKAVLQEKQTAYEDVMLTAQQRESERKGKNALTDDQGNQGVFDSITRIHKETAESCMQGLNERQKAMLGDYFDKRGRAFSSWGHEYEQRERGVYEKGQADAYQQSQILRALNNPGELQAAMGNYAQSVLEFNRSRGIDDEATKLQIQEGWDKAGLAIVKQALEADDIGAATTFLAQHGRDLSPALVRDLGTRIQSAQEKVYWETAEQLKNNGDVEALERLKRQGMPSPSAQGLNGGIAAQTAQFQGRTVYGFGHRDPEKGSVDCSGWVGYALEKCGVKGYRGLTADKMVDKARRQGGAVSVQDLVSHPRGGIVIGLDQGKKGWDAGRVDGIDHVVVTYEDPATGRIMVSESSGRQGAAGSGVHGTPLEKWLSYHQRKGHKIFAGDISGQAQGTGSMPSGSKPRMDAKMDKYLEQAKEIRDKKQAEASADDILAQVRGMPEEVRYSRAVELADKLPESIRAKVLKDVDSNLKWDDTVKQARAAEEVQNLYKMVVQPSLGEKSYNDRIAAVRATQASQEAKDYVIKELEKQRDGEDNKYASSVALGQYKTWYDELGGNPDPDEAKAKMIELNLNNKDMERAREYAGKYQEYPLSDVRKYAKQIDKNFSEDKVALVHEALMRDKDIVSGQKLSDEQIKNKVYSLMQKGRFAYDDDPWYGGPRVSYRNAPVYEGVLKGDGGKLRAEIPEGVKVNLEKTLVDELPWFKTASKEAKDVAIQKVYMWRTYGINIDLTPIEKSQVAAAIKKHSNAIGGKN